MYIRHKATGAILLHTEHGELRETAARLSALEISGCPFSLPPVPNAPVHWVRPEAVAEVTHQGWSGEGRLRAPVFVRWRPDKSPEECVELL